jgi:hypothetical protein
MVSEVSVHYGGKSVIEQSSSQNDGRKQRKENRKSLGQIENTSPVTYFL